MPQRALIINSCPFFFLINERLLPVISNGNLERERAQAGHCGVGHLIHHPVDVLLQQDGKVTGQELERLPVLDYSGVRKDPVHQVSS